MIVPENLTFEAAFQGMGKHIIFDHMHGALGVKVLLFDMNVPDIFIKEMEELGWKYVLVTSGEFEVPTLCFIRQDIDEDTFDWANIGKEDAYYVPLTEVMVVRQAQLLRLHKAHTQKRETILDRDDDSGEL